MVSTGMARITNSTISQLEAIKAHTQEQLTKLQLKFASVDKAKTSFSYMGVLSLLLLFSSVFLNDFIKLAVYVCKEYTNTRPNKINIKVERIRSRKSSMPQSDENLYSEQLDARLEQMHIMLMQAKYARDSKNRHLIYQV